MLVPAVCLLGLLGNLYTMLWAGPIADGITFVVTIILVGMEYRKIKKLAQERPTLRFACCEWLFEELIKCGVNKRNIDVLEIGKKYNYKLFKIVPIKLYHDVPQCGYRVLFKDYKVIYATDTKTLEGISAKNYDLYLIEANYTKEEMEERIRIKQEQYKYAYEFRAKVNHLSKEETDKFLLENMGENSKYVYMHQHIEK